MSIALRGTLALAKLRQLWTDGPDREREARLAGIDTWDTYVAGRIGELAEEVKGLWEAVDRLERDPERAEVIRRVLANYREDAWREAVEHRRRVLGDAAARTITSDRPPEELARIQRTLARLDPEDLDLLIRVWEPPAVGADLCRQYRTRRDPAGNDSLGGQRQEVLRDGYLGGASLVASGCLLVTVELHRAPFMPRAFETRREADSLGDSRLPDAVPIVHVTQLGVLVLRFMGLVDP